MWVSQKTLRELHKQLWETLAVNKALEARIAAQTVTQTWLASRVNQVEHERAQLLFNYTGVQMNVPKLTAPSTQPPVEDTLAQAVTFADVGDEIAQKMGISWADDGSLVYGK